MAGEGGAVFRSQFGEDRILAQYFGGEKGVYLEVGAYDGVTLSNTAHFEDLGWTGVLIEAVPELAAKCRESRPRSTVVNCAAVPPSAVGKVSFEHWRGASGHSTLSGVQTPKALRGSSQVDVEHITVDGRTIDDVLQSAGITKLSFVTIDIEGHEYSALQGFDLRRWRPDIVIVESNGYSPERRVVRHIVEQGYGFLRTTGVNTWFGRVDAPGLWPPKWTRLAYPMSVASYVLARGIPRVRGLASRLVGRGR